MIPPESVSKDELERLRYPIGRFQAEAGISSSRRDELIDDLAALPADLRTAVSDLSGPQLDTAYRPGGWTVRQVIHHLPDSHMNGYVRFRLAVTEDQPTIKGYDETAWAELPDARHADVALSLALLEALHRRWTTFLRTMDPDQYRTAFIHPQRGPVTLEDNLQLYAWHGRHHLAHVTHLRERMGW